MEASYEKRGDELSGFSSIKLVLQEVLECFLVFYFFC
jgi:hypothetical protein